MAARLARSEVDYHVISLPDRLGLIVGDLAEQDCRDFAASVRAETPNEDRRLRVHCLVYDEVLKGPAKLNDLINRIKVDSFEPVRTAGPKVLLLACASRYDALGQYTNAVDTLHQAILLDPEDAGSYNPLAWIKATCPDASVRNGDDAVSAAIKACELTKWKNWRWIDTLAAAYAESSDFKKAIQFQEQALSTGNPHEPEQKIMRERLSLYKESRPFRENPVEP